MYNSNLIFILTTSRLFNISIHDIMKISKYMNIIKLLLLLFLCYLTVHPKHPLITFLLHVLILDVESSSNSNIHVIHSQLNALTPLYIPYTIEYVYISHSHNVHWVIIVHIDHIVLGVNPPNIPPPRLSQHINFTTVCY
jgi:hypothetical protein